LGSFFWAQEVRIAAPRMIYKRCFLIIG